MGLAECTCARSRVALGAFGVFSLPSGALPPSASSFVFDYGGQVTAPLIRRWSSRAEKLLKSNSFGPASELQASGGAEPLQRAVVVFLDSSKLE